MPSESSLPPISTRSVDTPLTLLARQVQLLDAQTFKAVATAEVNKKFIERNYAALVQVDKRLAEMNDKLDKVGRMLERIGWLVLGCVILVMLATVLSAVLHVM